MLIRTIALRVVKVLAIGACLVSYFVTFGIAFFVPGPYEKWRELSQDAFFAAISLALTLVTFLLFRTTKW
jgi:hypothetical protein